MTISPVSSGAPGPSGPVGAATPHQHSSKPQSHSPQDTVSMSSAARAHRGQSAGDIDHDGDSR